MRHQLPNVDPANGWTYFMKLLPDATSTTANNGGGGTVFNVISKSGGNEFHGALYESA
jgi:hypothetical protein